MSLDPRFIQAAVDAVYGRSEASWVDTWMRNQQWDNAPPWIEQLADLADAVHACYAEGAFDDVRLVHALARIAELASA